MSLFAIDIFSRALVLDVSFDKFMNYNDNILLFSKINCLLINSMYWICSFLLLLTNLVKRLPKIVTISELSYFFWVKFDHFWGAHHFLGGLVSGKNGLVPIRRSLAKVGKRNSLASLCCCSTMGDSRWRGVKNVVKVTEQVLEKYIGERLHSQLKLRVASWSTPIV